MIKESEVAHFLQLINHISESKQIQRSLEKQQQKRRKLRYDNALNSNYQLRQTLQNINQRKSLNSLQLPSATKSVSNNEYKMPTIIQQIKYQNKKMTELQNIGINQLSISKNKKSRSNMYQNYCQMMKKKRSIKLNKILSTIQMDQMDCRKSVFDTAQFSKKQKLAKRKSVDSVPLVKTKNSKSQQQEIRILNNQNAIKSNQHRNRKKVQPEQLTIQHINYLKLNKINSNTIQNISSKRKSRQLSRILQPKSKKSKIINSVEGWKLDEQQTYFNVDIF